MKKLLNPDFSVYLFLGFIVFEMPLEIYLNHTYRFPFFFSDSNVSYILTNILPTYVIFFYLMLIQMLDKGRWWLGFILVAHYLHRTMGPFVLYDITISGLSDIHPSFWTYFVDNASLIALILVSFTMFCIWRERKIL
jgi:hypothetical protein